MDALRRTLTALVTVAALALGWPGPGAQAQRTPGAGPAWVPGEVLVLVAPSGSNRTLAVESLPMVTQSRPFARSRRGAEYRRVQLAPGTDVQQAVEAFRDDPGVSAAAPNYLNHFRATPNDPHYGAGLMWGLYNTGQTIPDAVYETNNPGSAGSDVAAPAAWDLATGSPEVVVAVIDTGVDYRHPDLAGAMWDASAATFGGTSAPSPYHGYDFADGEPDPYPLADAHGTHVAGTLGACRNDGTGVPGIAGGAGAGCGVRLMALKVFPDRGGGATDADLIAAINYARENGAHIANLSLGRPGDENTVLTAAVEDAVAAGMLLVVAAGNAATDNDAVPQWPANYAALPSTAAGVLSVAATDQADALANFSNYGATTVTLGAPGVNIQSTIAGREVLLSSNDASKDDGTYNGCETDIATGFAGTPFAQPGDDCRQSGLHRWGWYKPPGQPLEIWGDLFAAAGSYENGIYSEIVFSGLSADPSGAAYLALHYTTAWDTECAYDGVWVDVYNGSAYLATVQAGELNINETLSGLCDQSGLTYPFSHTGRTYPVFGIVTLTRDLTPYASADLNVHFWFWTDTTVNSSSVTGGFRMWDVDITREASDFTAAYALFKGTSMAAPLVAGIAALVKSRNPAYTGADLREALVNSVDPVGGLDGLVSAGGRANASSAVRYIQPPGGVIASR